MSGRIVATSVRPWVPLVAILLALATPAHAFDTGHHSDLTDGVLQRHGLGDTAIRAVQVANWLTDYYAVSPTSKDEVEVQLAKLHFDNLYNTEEVDRYWRWLVHNAMGATRSAAKSDDPLAMLTVMGLFLHAVQDFYSHSNWVETHPRDPDGPYRCETWLTTGASEDAGLFTGTYPPYPSPPPTNVPAHGDYEAGLNKDSHVRPLWDEAYVFAYCASHEVVGAMRQWAEQTSPGFWSEVQTYDVDETKKKQLDDDFEAAFKISMWVKGKGEDGHWKGNQSGTTRYLSDFVPEWMGSPASMFVKQVKKHRVHEQLAYMLYSEEIPPALPPIPAYERHPRAVVVGTTHVEEKRDGGPRIDRGGQADLYSVVTVGTQKYIDRVVRRKKAYERPWLTLHITETETAAIPIRLEVWDEDGFLRGQIDQCDINPSAGKNHVTFQVRMADDVLTGQIEGLHDSPEKAFEIAGEKPDKNRVVLKAYVYTRQVRVAD